MRFLVHYALPVACFAYCYARIFHTLRRQSKVVAGHAARSQNVAMTTMSRDQVQQQAAGATTGAKLSRIELNVLHTMVAVIVGFMICYTVMDIANFLQLFGVSQYP